MRAKLSSWIYLFVSCYSLVCSHPPIHSQGVSSVRQHLRDIDDVPLLVSLFADASSATAEEMLRILQENGGVVCVLGSPLHGENTRLFQQADVAVAFGAHHCLTCHPIVMDLSRTLLLFWFSQCRQCVSFWFSRFGSFYS